MQNKKELQIPEEAIYEGFSWLTKQPTKLSQGDLLFVYGTLKRGGHNNYLLRDSEFISEATTVDEWPMQDIVVSPVRGHGFRIVGELWRPSFQSWPWLDRLESHPHGYRRAQIQVRDSKGAEHTAWLYFYNLPLFIDWTVDRFVPKRLPECHYRAYRRGQRA